MTVSETVHFVADAHLVSGQPESWQAFFAYLNGPARTAKRLYLLGDIFDAWIGDDDDRELANCAREEFSSLVSVGVATSFIFGNHDFMVGKQFSTATGVALLGEHHQLALDGRRVLLMHGDTLITSEQAYQRARTKMLRPWRLAVLRLLPQSTRNKIAARLNQNKAVDFATLAAKVDNDLVLQLLNQHNCSIMIHGHTHMPAKHELANGKERWVLPAWTATSGGYLQYRTGTWELCDFKL